MNFYVADKLQSINQFLTFWWISGSRK